MAQLARLKKRAEFLKVAGGRRKWVAPGLILQALRQDVQDQAADAAKPKPALRVGFTASRKVGISVVRNRARRRLKAAVQAVMPLHAAPDHDYVLVARAETVRRPYAELVSDLETALKRLGTWREVSGRDSAAADGLERKAGE